MKLIKSNIYSNGKYYKYLLIKSGKIEYIGNEKPNKKINYNFSKQFIYPSFIDSHVHLLWHGLNLIRCNISNTKNANDIYEKLIEYYKEHKDIQYIIAEGFDETNFNNKSFPQKKVLDGLFPHIPVVVRRVCGHIAVINESAYKKLKKYSFQYDKNTGIIKEGIVLHLNKVFIPTDDEKIKAFYAAQNDFFSKGITTVGDMCTEDSLDVYKNIKSKLDILFYYPYAKRSKLRNWKNRKNIFLKGLKVFMDGSIGGYTAYNSHNYKYKKTKGLLLINSKELKLMLNYSEKNNLQMAVHAIGDRAINIVVNTLKSEHRIEHFELANKKQIEIVRNKNIYLSMQPNFIGNWGMRNQMYEKRLLKKYFEFNNSINYIKHKNVKLGLGSDCMPVSGIYGINSLKNALFDNQKLTTLSSLELYSKGSANIMHIKNNGNIEKNNFADFIVLDKKINKVKNDNSIIYTFKRGEIVYKRRKK